MAKIIKYKFLSGEKLLDTSIECKTQADFDANYPIAEKETVGEILIEGEFDPEPETETEASVWDELDAAYQEGVNSV